MVILVEDKILIRLHLLLPNPPINFQGITRRSDQGPPQEPRELTLHPLVIKEVGKEVILHQMVREEVIHLQEGTDLKHHHLQEGTDLEHHLQEGSDLKHHHHKDLDIEHPLQTPTSTQSSGQSHHLLILQGVGRGSSPSNPPKSPSKGRTTPGNSPGRTPSPSQWVNPISYYLDKQDLDKLKINKNITFCLKCGKDNHLYEKYFMYKGPLKSRCRLCKMFHNTSECQQTFLNKSRPLLDK